LRTQFPADLGILEGVPGIDYKDHAVAFHARTFREAFDGIVELIHVARSGRQELMQEYLAQTEFGPEVSKGFREYMFNKFEEWIAGSWDPRAEPEKQDKKLQKYFGAR